MADSDTIELLKKLAWLSGWSISEDRLEAIAAVYEAIAADTRLLRQVNLEDAVPYAASIQSNAK